MINIRRDTVWTHRCQFGLVFHRLGDFQNRQIFSRVLRDSTPRYVGPLVRRSVGWSPFYFFGVFELFEPTALVTISSTAPAHPHATRVDVYPVLFNYIFLFLLHMSYKT